MHRFLLTSLLSVSTLALAVGTIAPLSIAAKPKPSPAAQKPVQKSLNGIWLGKLTSGGQYMMGYQSRLTENRGRLKLEYLGRGTSYEKVATGRRVGQRVELQDGDTRLVGTISREGNRIQFAPTQNRFVLTLYRLGAPGCPDTGDFKRNFDTCHSK